MSGSGRHEPIEIDPSPFGLPGYNAVFDYLTEREIYFEQRGDLVVIPAQHAPAVADLLAEFARSTTNWDPFEPRINTPLDAWVRGQLHRSDHVVPQADSTVDSNPVVVLRAASLWSRPIRYVVDGLVVSFGARVAWLVLSPSVGGRWAALLGYLVAILVLLVTPNARTGRTVGALLTNTRLVRFSDLDRPGWGRSALRSFVPYSVWLVAGLLSDLSDGRRVDTWIWSVALVAWIACYVTVLVEPDRRGVHDLLSGTIVVDHHPRPG